MSFNTKSLCNSVLQPQVRCSSTYTPSGHDCLLSLHLDIGYPTSNLHSKNHFIAIFIVTVLIWPEKNIATRCYCGIVYMHCSYLPVCHSIIIKSPNCCLPFASQGADFMLNAQIFGYVCGLFNRLSGTTCCLLLL